MLGLFSRMLGDLHSMRKRLVADCVCATDDVVEQSDRGDCQRESGKVLTCVAHRPYFSRAVCSALLRRRQLRGSIEL